MQWPRIPDNLMDFIFLTLLLRTLYSIVQKFSAATKFHSGRRKIENKLTEFELLQSI